MKRALIRILVVVVIGALIAVAFVDVPASRRMIESKATIDFEAVLNP